MERLISLLGLFVMIGLAWLMSSHRWKVNWRLVGSGLFLLFALALVFLKTAIGRSVFSQIGDLFKELLSFVDAGAGFVFGPRFSEFQFAFKVLPTIIFFSSLMAVLYHLGVMQWIVTWMSRGMQWTLGTSGAETLAAAANVFVGHTEAPLVVRPYLARMTLSELNAMMVGGFATISGGLLAAYVEMGIDAGHLVTASVISAPAGLLIAKILQPETKVPETLGRVDVRIPRQSVNMIGAAAHGAGEGLKLALNVAAMLLAFLALIAMVDALVGWIGSWFAQEWSLALGLGYAFSPLAWVMGIPIEDCRPAGELLGLKLVANEFIAYERMGTWLEPGSEVQISERTQTILTYALSGFSNFGAIGIQIAGIGGLAPERSSDLARLGLRAMLGGALACCMTACVAGMLI